MRRLTVIIAISLLLVSLAACVSSASPMDSALPKETDEAHATATATESPSADHSQPPAADEKWEEIFTDFLTENYEKLAETFISGIPGVGFIDLDVDGSPELILFDAGASASMGVQLFDIVDDKVTCVSANMTTVAEEFGGEHLSDVSVNASFFEDFRLMETSAGERYFIVESGNGAIDFSYTEIVRFDNENGALSLQSLLYKYEEYNDDTGAVLSARYEQAGTEINEATYNSLYSSYFQDASDTGFKAEGMFIWDCNNYVEGYDGLMIMTQDAIDLYTPLFDVAE